MGDRDHSTKCEVCKLQRGGLNDYKCDCDEPPLDVTLWQQSSLLTHMTNDGKIQICRAPDWSGDVEIVAANNVSMAEIRAILDTPRKTRISAVALLTGDYEVPVDCQLTARELRRATALAMYAYVTTEAVDKINGITVPGVL